MAGIVGWFALLGGEQAGAAISFGNATRHEVGGFPTGLNQGDLNGDGNVDLVVGIRDPAGVAVLLGKGDGKFQKVEGVPLKQSPDSLTLTDLNGDGKLDLVAGFFAGKEIAVALGDGHGTFGPPRYEQIESRPHHAYAADYNGDGLTDLCVTYAGHFCILTGKGDGTFTSRKDYPFPPGNMLPGTLTGAVADFNGDNYPDLAMNDLESSRLCLYTNAGDGTFLPGEAFTAGAKAQGAAAGDLNRDGKTDLVIASFRGETLTVLPGRGDGTFDPFVGYPSQKQLSSLALADFDLDGWTDGVTTSSNTDKVSIYANKGDGTFRAKVDVSVGGTQFDASPFAVTVADVNRDGRPDLAVVNQAGTEINLMLNKTSLPVRRGDVNDDRNLTVDDAVMVLRILVESHVPTARQKSAADVNLDGSLDVQDAVLLLRTVVGLELPS